ncbi:MAG: amidase [Gammaproteobacteria bacterium]|nr:amidase [Gammaproteobacteria bacterium]
MSELCFESATRLVELITSRQVSCVEVLDAHLARIDAINPKLNAIVSLAPELARTRAQQLDRDFPDHPPPLYGLPIAHKDLVLTRGIRTTFGSPLFKDHVPTIDDLIVERLRHAGAVCLGKTNVPEFGAGSQTFNTVFGATRNPYDLDKTCGGSSGGAAAALAARLLPIADGSDFGGSLRNPAAFCNVVGMRPTPGRVPAFPTRNPWFDLPVQGPMARSVADVALMLSTIAGEDPRVPLSLTEPGNAFFPVRAIAPRGLRVALAPDLGGLPVEGAVRAAIEQIGSVVSSLGVRVELACPDLTDAREIFHVLRANSFRERFGSLAPAERAQLKDTIQWNLAQGEALTIEAIDRAWTLRTALYQRIAAFFGEFDFLLCPTTQVLPFSVDEPYVREIDGTPMNDYLDWMQSCAQLTVTGCPSISIPAGFSAAGLPIGLQITARPRADADLLAFAQLIETATRHGSRPPTLDR